MRSLLFLLLTNVKNSLKELRKNPARLVTVIIFVALLIFVIFSTKIDDNVQSQNHRNIKELFAIVLLLYTYIFVAACMKGLSSGASFYSMADVNILFSTPISSKKILMYGLIKQMGTSLLVGIFLIYQYAWLNSTYGISLMWLVGILLGYGAVIFCSQLTAMVIYSFTSNDDRLQDIVRNIFIVVISAFAVFIFFKAVNGTGGMLNSAVEAADSFWINFLPVAGWAKMAVIGFFSSNYTYILLGIGLLLMYVLILIYVITNTRSDFYEDVLLATEVSLSAITAKKEGHIIESSKRHVKVGKTGLGRGRGANVFFYKHLLENKRSGLFLIDRTSMFFIIIIIVYSYFIRSIFPDNMGSILPLFIFSTYMQIISSFTGRWLRELNLPFVYMLPGSPFRKLVGICEENILKISAEAALLFIVIGFLVHLEPVEVAACIIGRIGFGILFMSGNILTERVLGTLMSKVIIMFAYIIIMLVLALPGIVAAIFVSSKLSVMHPAAAGLVITCVWNILVSALVIYLCRDILNYAELNNR